MNISEYACMGLKYAKILNMAKSWIWQGSEYARIIQGSKCQDMAEYVWVYNNRQGSEYTSYTIHSTRSLYKLMSTYWKIDIFRTQSKI